VKTQGPHYRVPFRRRREGRTDYRHRAGMLRAGVPRAVVRKTLNQTLVQLVTADPKGDRILASARSFDLREFGWSVGAGNVPAAYLTGFLAGKRAKAGGVSRAVLDIGRHKPTKGGRLFAALQGLVDAGLEIPRGEEILPPAERIRGDHIGDGLGKLFDDVKKKLEAS
jgi:large subunit ribosomal protein L18